MNHNFISNNSKSIEAIEPITTTNKNYTNTDKYIQHFIPIQLAVDQAIIKFKSDKNINISLNYGNLKYESIFINKLKYYIHFIDTSTGITNKHNWIL
ncbi:hypothetical protein PIROE2DRAFT_14436 [Piromyces sp. E2]|nr:hypothetical protein PIROE2DRAFT_14436 [Piromyces sp. E2]|eukprot:OUM59913.1 hypothetical protein PIROE2DRAFT_14436 [Piromyces sp. E2]